MAADPKHGTTGQPAVPDAFAEVASELLTLDGSGRIVDADDSLCAQLGYARQELLGLGIWDVSANQNEEGFGKLRAVLRSDGPQVLFGHNRRADGSTYAVEARLWAAKTADGERIFALLRDAAAYEGLIEERDQLISLVENSSEIIAVASLDGRYSYMNPAGLALVGVDSVGELADYYLADLHPESERARIEDEVVPAVRKGAWSGELSYRNVRTDVETPCWFNSFPVRHSQTGEVIGLAAVAHDVSERKAAERKRERLTRLNDVSRRVATSLLERDDLNSAVATILEGVGDVLGVTHASLCRYRDERREVHRTHVWVADEADDDGRAFARIVDEEPESALEIGWATETMLRGGILETEDVETAGTGLEPTGVLLRDSPRALLVAPVVIHGELESFFAFADATGPRVWDGEEVALLQIIVDSFSRAVERQVAKRERGAIARDLEHAVIRAQDANRQKSEFLAAISHELRSPMNSIIGYAELLGRPSVDRAKQGVWVANIRRSADFLRTLVNDLLDLSRIEAGQIAVEIRSCHLADLISEVEGLVRPSADEKELDLAFVYDGPVPDVLETDPVRFKQVLINLLINAIKFTHEGRVRARIHVAPDAEEEAGFLCVAIEDTGPGIPEESRARIFDPFAQVGDRADTATGAGLGLSISKRLATLLDGDITLESEVGRGSTFTFRKALSDAARASLQAMPVAPRAPAPRPEPVEPVPRLDGLRVLIADDNGDNRLVMRYLLSESGAECSSAENGALAVKAVQDAERRGHPFDVIILDMDMPVLDGYGAAREITARGVETPIVALTGLAQPEDEQRCRDAGCVDHVAKPLVPGSFFEAILRHVGERSGARAPVESEPAAAGLEPGMFSLASNPRFASLIERYVASFPESIETLRGAFARAALEDVRKRVHRLRGTAANYGFPEVTEAAGRCEDAIRGGSAPAEVGEALEALLGHLERIHAERHPG